MHPDENIPTHYRTTFADNMEMLLSNQGSIFRGTFEEGPVEGEGQSVVDQFGVTRGQRDDERYGDSPQNEVERARRWVFASTWDWGTLVERKDKLKQVLDPTSKLVNSAVFGLGENLDYDIMMPAFFGDARIGKLGNETETFDNTNAVVAVDVAPDGSTGGSNQGLNVKKLQLAVKKLKQYKNRLSMEELYGAITAEQWDNLFDQEKIVHGDYMKGSDGQERVLTRSSLPQLLGFTDFVEIEDLPTDGSGFRRIPIWVKSGMHLGMQEELFTNIAVRPEKKFMPYVYAAFTAGATRTQQGKVIEIKCAE